ncbi:arsenic resistance N-acetyltransferase ArsN2 [Gemmatimonas groenlandica]|uniref:GNAT family N-acetyltransferase n=1 Tax=Gemmatimonas groenlandica TaxID=2732249 RepID=A0A6M4ISG0_9BACT|nr:arsenic resistance N-acetyltransferase ArsN2 [Gemmatimonas groenlandica]QJR37008.1 GNAT family N-acetyltransferase [Gemmatimonas groenlandica]
MSTSLTMTPTFRGATVGDTNAILQLLTAAGLPVAGVADLLSTDARQFVVAEADARDVVAVAGLEVCCNNALLRSVAVRSDWQRHRLGHQLVQRIVCEAESRGIEALYLLTMTAEHYFPRFGFDVVARDAVPAEIANTLEFKSACPASAVAMTRALVTPIPSPS